MDAPQEAHRRRLHEIKAKLARLLEAAPGSTARVDILKRSLALPDGLLDVVASHVAQVNKVARWQNLQCSVEEPYSFKPIGPNICISKKMATISPSGNHVQEAEDEPRGLDGCVLHVFFEGRHDRHTLGSLNCCSHPGCLAPAFEIRDAIQLRKSLIKNNFSFGLTFYSLRTVQRCVFKIFPGFGK